MYLSIFKRLFDLTMAIIALILLFPFAIPICIILLLTGEHEIFYLQLRVGHKNSHFKIWKFATMLKNSSKMGTGSLTIRNDPRVLPIGKFLRKTKINEFPQLINVLIGNMSMVGPRPYMEVDFLKFPSHIRSVIYNSKPGITGISSIVFRDEQKWISDFEGDKHDFYKYHIAPYKGELELWYQKNLSLITDFKLLLLTVWAIFAPKSELVYSVFKDLPNKPEELC